MSVPQCAPGAGEVGGCHDGRVIEGFVDAVRVLGGRPAADGCEGVAARLLERWREPHRGYHDEQHLREVLAAVDTVRGAALDLRGRAAVTLAAWYHDAVYEGRPGEDEEASARLAESELSARGLDGGAAARVAGLVRSTAEHRLPSDPDGPEAVLHDADLWILASPPERFDEYCRQVRAEYPHVSDDDYGRGRRGVLTPFVTRPRLYATRDAHERWTAAARANLRRELARLG